MIILFIVFWIEILYITTGEGSFLGESTSIHNASLAHDSWNIATNDKHISKNTPKPKISESSHATSKQESAEYDRTTLANVLDFAGSGEFENDIYQSNHSDGYLPDDPAYMIYSSSPSPQNTHPWNVTDTSGTNSSSKYDNTKEGTIAYIETTTNSFIHPDKGDFATESILQVAELLPSLWPIHHDDIKVTNDEILSSIDSSIPAIKPILGDKEVTLSFSLKFLDERNDGDDKTFYHTDTDFLKNTLTKVFDRFFANTKEYGFKRIKIQSLWRQQNGLTVSFMASYSLITILRNGVDNLITCVEEKVVPLTVNYTGLGLHVDVIHVLLNVTKQLMLEKQRLLHLVSSLCEIDQLCHPGFDCISTNNTESIHGITCMNSCYNFCTKPNELCVLEGGVKLHPKCRCKDDYIDLGAGCWNTSVTITVAAALLFLNAALFVVAIIFLTICLKRSSDKNSGQVQTLSTAPRFKKFRRSWMQDREPADEAETDPRAGNLTLEYFNHGFDKLDLSLRSTLDICDELIEESHHNTPEPTPGVLHINTDTTDTTTEASMHPPSPIFASRPHPALHMTQSLPPTLDEPSLYNKSSIPELLAMKPLDRLSHLKEGALECSQSDMDNSAAPYLGDSMPDYYTNTGYDTDVCWL